MGQRISDIKWYMEDTIAYYKVTTKNGSFSIKDGDD